MSLEEKTPESRWEDSVKMNVKEYTSLWRAIIGNKEFHVLWKKGHYIIPED
jgi:hypothetical protein